MKEEYWFFGGLLLLHIGRLSYSYYYNWKYKQADVDIADFNYNAYLDLRQQTFAVSPADLGLTFPNNTETAFGLITEIHTGDAIHSIVAFSTGEVWTYNSKNPRKHISNEKNDDLKAEAIAAMAVTQYHYARMRRNNKDELLPGHIKFHILTNQDVYSAGDAIEKFADKSSEWEELFEKAFAVIDEWNSAAKSNSFKRVYTKINVKRLRPANL